MHLSRPDRTEVRDSEGRWIATFTAGSRTVTLGGRPRVFSEATAEHPVRSSVWVRLLDRPFVEPVNEAWLRAALQDASPDILAVAMEYVEGAADALDEGGRRSAGDASYGPWNDGRTRRRAGADFNDFIGVPWAFGDDIRPARVEFLGALDCSGFVRMVYGYRSGFPLGRAPDGLSLPRRSFEMLDSAPGVVVVPNERQQVMDTRGIAPGDLLFFDAAPDEGDRIDHVGIYLGLDDAGRPRFISSRWGIDGPTLGDYRGRSVLDGTGLFARSFRAVRRL